MDVPDFYRFFEFFYMAMIVFFDMKFIFFRFAFIPRPADHVAQFLCISRCNLDIFVALCLEVETLARQTRFEVAWIFRRRIEVLLRLCKAVVDVLKASC